MLQYRPINQYIDISMVDRKSNFSTNRFLISRFHIKATSIFNDLTSIINEITVGTIAKCACEESGELPS